MHKDIVILNPKSNIAICTLWTKKEYILDLLSDDIKKKIAVIGGLYTPLGINYMLETLGEFNTIDTIIIYGADLSESGKIVLEVFNQKKTENLRVDINKAKIIINTTKIIDLHKQAKDNNLNFLIASKASNKVLREEQVLIETVKKNYKENFLIKRDKLNLKIEEDIGISSWPNPIVNQKIYETSVFKAWIKLLYLIYNFGSLKFSEYGESQKEIINLSTTINLQGLQGDYEIEKEFLKVYNYFTKREFEKHIEEILTSKKSDGIEYTYGERLREHRYGKDQIDFIIEKLSKTPYSRRSIGITWDHEKDIKSSSPPCIVAIQGIITDNYYNHTCFIRSNDMTRAWPINMIGQIRLAEYIVKGINKKAGTDYKVGNVTTISVSAHIYEHDFGYAKEILSKNTSNLSEFILDSIGNIVIYHKNNKVVIEHRTTNHKEIVSKKEFKDFNGAYKYLKDICIFMLPLHALYIGKEIKNAFERLEKGEKYIQDEA